MSSHGRCDIVFHWSPQIGRSDSFHLSPQFCAVPFPRTQEQTVEVATVIKFSFLNGLSSRLWIPCILGYFRCRKSWICSSFFWHFAPWCIAVSQSSLGLYLYAGNSTFNQLLKNAGLDVVLPQRASGTGVSRPAVG